MSAEIKRKPIEKVYAAIAMIVGIIFLFSLLGQSIAITTKVPLYGIVYVDQNTNIYYAPPYILSKKYPSTLDISNIKAYTVAETITNKFKPDSQCIELGYFQEQDTLTHTVLVKMGLSQPKPSRWNPDGSWNW